MDGQSTIIASKLFKWVVINLPFAGPCITQRKMRLAFSRHYWRDALGIFMGLIGMGQGMWAWEGHAELGQTNEAAVLADLYRVTYYH